MKIMFPSVGLREWGMRGGRLVQGSLIRERSLSWVRELHGEGPSWSLAPQTYTGVKYRVGLEPPAWALVYSPVKWG